MGLSNNELIGKAAQTIAPAWILAVWFLRFDKDTGYRGGEATNMLEEFAEYGFSKSQMYAVGATKVGLAAAMLAGHAEPKLTRPASIGLAAMMLGAVGMHVKVGDPAKRSIPALTVFALATASAVLSED